MSLPLRITLRLAAAIALVWAMSTYMSEYFVITGGYRAWILLGVVFAVLNLLVRPILTLLSFPLKLVMTLAAFIVANGLFLWIALKISESFDPALLTFRIEGGVVGWLLCILAIGLAHTILKAV